MQRGRRNSSSRLADLAERLRLAKECHGRCDLETNSIEALEISVKIF